MSEVVDLTEESNDDFDHGQETDPGPPAPPINPPIPTLRIHVDMCPISKPSIRFGPGRGGGGRAGNFYRRYVENDVVAKMGLLREICRSAASAHGMPIIPRNQPVSIKAWFFLKRPAEDFTSRRRAVGRLREEALSVANTVVPVKPDVDNFAKFLLDSLTGGLFVDDAQVVTLHMYKLRDNEGLCNGRMQIECTLFHQSLESILPGW